MENNILSFQDAERLSPEQLNLLLSPDGLEAYDLGFDVTVITNYESDILKEMITDNGLFALRQNLLSHAQARELHVPQLQLLLTDNGLIALRKRLITSEQAKNIHPDRLFWLFYGPGLQALGERLLTLHQLVEFPYPVLNIVLQKQGTTALRNKWITPEQIKDRMPEEVELLIKDTMADKRAIQDASSWSGFWARTPQVAVVEESGFIKLQR